MMFMITRNGHLSYVLLYEEEINKLIYEWDTIYIPAR